MAGATHLVGRASELGAVDSLLAEVGEGRSAALELVGEPGIGKTRLLSELASRADARRYLVLSGRASSSSTCRSGFSSTRSTSSSTGSTRTASKASTATSRLSSQPSSRHWPASQLGAELRASTSATAATGPYACCSKRLRRP